MDIVKQNLLYKVNTSWYYKIYYSKVEWKSTFVKYGNWNILLESWMKSTFQKIFKKFSIIFQKSKNFQKSMSWILTHNQNLLYISTTSINKIH